MIWCVNLLLMLNMFQVSVTQPISFFWETGVEDQIRLYCTSIHLALENVTVVYRFVNFGGNACRDVSTSCLKSYNLPKFVDDTFSPELPGTVIFLNDTSLFYRKLRSVGTTKSLYHVIFCAEMDDDEANKIAARIWHSNVAYFVVVYVSSNGLRVISYDQYAAAGKPFLNFTNNYENMFAKRPKSLIGLSPSYLTADTYPITVCQEGQLRGEYIEMIEALETCFHSKISNHSVGLMPNLGAIDISYLFEKYTLICIKPIMYTEKGKQFVTYPIDIKEFVILVPIEKVKNEFNYIFSILTYKIIICFFVLLVIMAYLTKNLTLGYNLFSFHVAIFDYFGSFLGLPIEKFEVKRSAMLLSWLIFSLIVTVQFKGIFLNDIFNMQNEDKINTIQELKARKMNIYISFEMSNIKNHDNVIDLKDQIKFVSQPFLIKSIINNSKNAFVVTDTMAKGFLNLHVRHLINFKYRVMDERLASFIMAHPVNTKSPLIDDINWCILRARDAGMQKSSFVSWPKNVYDNRNRLLTSIHFAGSFILLVIGYLISSIVFVAELVLDKLARRKEVQVIVPYVN